MNKHVKNACIFASGAAVGFVVCGVSMVKIALENEDVKRFVAGKISDRIYEFISDEEVPRRQSNKKVSYRDAYYYKHVDDIFFDSRETAEKVLKLLKEIINEYGFVTIADMYDLVGLNATYTEQKYGWVDLKEAKIIRVRSGYKLVLPEIIPIG